MAVLGIITCEILELECAHLLSTDPEIAGVTVVEDAHSAGFIEALESKGRFEPHRIPLMKGSSSNFRDGLEVWVHVLELGLHSRKRLLQEGLVKAVTEMARYVDGIMLGYGLCGSAWKNRKNCWTGHGVPGLLPQDEGHCVDDCVGLIIGGRTSYYEEQCKEAGTFFMIPGSIKHWRTLFAQEYGKLDSKMAKRIFSGYKRSLLIPTSVLSEEEMSQNIMEFNSIFDFRTEVRQGTLEILHRTWERAKEEFAKN